MVLLVEAAKAGDYAEVEAALARGDDVNATDEVRARGFRLSRLERTKAVCPQRGRHRNAGRSAAMDCVEWVTLRVKRGEGVSTATRR